MNPRRDFQCSCADCGEGAEAQVLALRVDCGVLSQAAQGQLVEFAPNVVYFDLGLHLLHLLPARKFECLQQLVWYEDTLQGLLDLFKVCAKSAGSSFVCSPGPGPIA